MTASVKYIDVLQNVQQKVYAVGDDGRWPRSPMWLFQTTFDKLWSGKHEELSVWIDRKGREETLREWTQKIFPSFHGHFLLICLYFYNEFD